MIVEVYRNLNKKCWSIRHKGRVIAHATSAIGYDGDFIVREGGRQKAVRESQRNLHAFCKADIHTLINPEFRYGGYENVFKVENHWSLPQGVKEVTYNPFKDTSFVTKEGERVSFGAPIFMMGNMKVYTRYWGWK